MENQDSKVKFCFSFEYILLLFIDKAFAFITFTDDTCVDHCMTKRKQFNDEYGITIKRLLPDSITKCERLMSSTDIVIRLDSPGIFTRNFLDRLEPVSSSVVYKWRRAVPRSQNPVGSRLVLVDPCDRFKSIHRLHQDPRITTCLFLFSKICGSWDPFAPLGSIP
jgi:hypothetical protein